MRKIYRARMALTAAKTVPCHCRNKRVASAGFGHLEKEEQYPERMDSEGIGKFYSFSRRVWLRL
jgi:hypothetical protein